ncbi:MAG: TolC family protein [Bacteroidales bacterium]
MRKYGYITALMLAASTALMAQEAADRSMLTIDAALEITKSSNPMMKAIHHEDEAASKERKAALGYYMPKVELIGSYAFLSDDIGLDLNPLKEQLGSTVTGLLPVIPESLRPIIVDAMGKLASKDFNFIIQDKQLGLVGATIQQPIFTGGKITAANRAAKIKEREAQTKGNQAEAALVSELVERYYALTLANQVVLLREQVLEGMNKHLHDAILLEESGLASKADRMYAQSYQADATKELIGSTLFANSIHYALTATLGEAGDYTPVSGMFIVQDLESVDYFKAMALQGNPMVKQVSLKAELAKEGVRLERSEFMPHVALMGAFDVVDYQYSKHLPTWAIGVGVKMTLFDGLKRERKFAAAKSTLRQVEAYGEKANADVQALIVKLYNSLEASSKQIPSINTSLEFASEYLRIKEEAFAEGAASSTEVVDARLNLNKIKTERLQVAYTYNVTLAKLLEACGISEQFVQYASRSSNQIINCQ